MNSMAEIRSLLEAGQQREIAELAASLQLVDDDIDKLERLALASPYALRQLLRNPEQIEALLDLLGFELDAGKRFGAE